MSRYKVDKWPGICHGCRRSVNEHRRSVAVKVLSEPEISPGAGFWLHADAGVRVQHAVQICLRCRGKSKNRDKHMHFIVRVSSP